MKKLVALLLTLCLLCLSVPVIAESQEFQSGPFTFQLPSDAKIEIEMEVTDSIQMFTISGSKFGEDYAIIGITHQYDEADVSEQEVMDYSNFYILMALMFGKDNMTMINPVESSMSMPCGQRVMYGITWAEDGSDIMVNSHYCDCGGFMLVSTGGFGHSLAADEMIRSAVRSKATVASNGKSYVIITADSGKIRTEASISGGLIKTAYKGETFELIEQSGDWYVVKADGRTGYIHSGVAAIQ